MTSDADTLRRRNRELEILNTIAQAMNRPVELEESLRVALANVSELLGLHTGWIFLLDEESGAPYLAAAQNLPPGLASNPKVMTGGCYCLDTFRSGDLAGAANINVITCTRLKNLMGQGTAGLRYHSSIPLQTSERRLGVLNVTGADWRKLSADDLRILHTVGDMLSIAIERARLFALAQRLGAAEERNRLAREIHDTIAQGLAGLVLRLESLDALLETGGDVGRAREMLARGTSLARANLEEARRSVLDLRAAPLEGCTLVEALEELATNVAEDSGIAASFTSDGELGRLSSRVELGLYRIAQEATTNAVRHSGASHLRLDLRRDQHEARLTVEDDGRGFDPAAIGGGRHGLVGIFERAKLMGGRLELASEPGRGTRLVVAVSLADTAT